IEQIGSPSEIYREPANTFVARFMGSPAMNLVRNNGEIIGFHPENFLPASQFEAGAEATHFPFRVSGVEDLGADILLYGSIPGAAAVAEAGAGAPRGGAARGGGVGARGGGAGG